MTKRPESGQPGERRSGALTTPAITAPKGGGAVRSIGEKFAANPVTGTASLSIPLPLTPGRGGSEPRLSLGYDSGAAHGPFGLGWGLGLPHVSRKTEKALPTYGGTDVFVLSGAEDLVPEPPGGDDLGDGAYEVVRYRPRVEGLYARIERWTTPSGESHWRSISRDNVTTVYGRDANSRIADPADPLHRIFTWLICESFDDRGNRVVYRYAEEGEEGIDRAAAHERHRDAAARTANRYLKSVRYGNRHSRFEDVLESADYRQDWLFELVLDYGDHDERLPTAAPQRAWPCRGDPFSAYRAGFEVRTYRLCRRILMFHHVDGEPSAGLDCLVRSLRLDYREDPAGAFLTSLTLTGHRRAGDHMICRSLPPIELTYSTAELGTRVDDINAANLPEGVDGGRYQWADLDGESISGVVTTAGGTWSYLPNEGGGRLGKRSVLPRQPSMRLDEHGVRLLDLAGDGRLDVVDLDGPVPGFFERDDDGGWAPFRAFTDLPNVDWNDGNLRFGDLNGDGHADAVASEGDALVWYPSLGEAGFGPGQRITGPRLLFAAADRSVHLADLSGDGLPDLVRIRNGEICYWPNLGHARFGARVVMDGAPLFDHQDRFDHRRVLLSDVDGSGTTDLIYLGADGVDLYANLLGNAWAARVRLPAFPPVADPVTVTVADLLGTGTACLVWSSPLPAAAGRRIRYADLMGVKPHLLIHVTNNMGAETAVEYASSTELYLRDRAEGRPWATRLPFPVHVVTRVETFDRINRTSFVTRYRYADGWFDPDEREFRGFGTVEQEDTEHLAEDDDPVHQLPPVCTRSWYHTGASASSRRYYPPPEHAVPEALAWLLDDTPLPAGLGPETEREARRALKGRLLRQEVYALDGDDLEPHPYTVVERNYAVRVLQAPASGRNGVFAVDPRETVTATCEREPRDARVAHEIVLAVDPFGTVLHSVTLAYGRGTPAGPSLPQRTHDVQATTLVTETKVQVTTVEPADGSHRVPVAYDTTTWQISGPGLDLARPRIGRKALEDLLAEDPQRRLVRREVIRFQADALTGPLPWGAQQSRGLVHETYRLAFTLTDFAGADLTDADLTDAGYTEIDGDWWIPSGTVRYAPSSAGELAHAEQHFFLPRRHADPFGEETTVEYDDYDLVPVETRDPAGNVVTAGERDAAGVRVHHVDYRVLSPAMVTDANRNRTAALFDALGNISATAVMGKPEDDTGDMLTGTPPDVTPRKRRTFWDDPDGQAAALLRRATTRVVHDFDAYRRTRATGKPQPAGVAVISRVRHVAEGVPGTRIAFTYADAAGQQIQQKVQAAPEGWLGSGWIVRNNKGKPVRQYEPFPSTHHLFEYAVIKGVSAVVCYDPPGRAVATLHPNHAYDKVRIGAWRQETWDVNDTAALPDTDGDPALDPDVAAFATALPDDDYLPTWFQQRDGQDPDSPAYIAAHRTRLHAGTPSVAHLDPLGRPILTVAHNRTPVPDADPVDSYHLIHTLLDIAGNRLEVVDVTSVGDDRLVARFHHDLAGRVLIEESMEAGARRLLVDVSDKPVKVWEEAERVRTIAYDALRRPTSVTVDDVVVQRTVYGDSVPGGDMANTRGRVHRIDDGAGSATTLYDVDGNPVSTARALLSCDAYRSPVDWGSDPALDEPLTGTQRWDALGRALEQTHPDGTVTRYTYDRAGLLDGVVVVPATGVETTVVESVRYNERGQRTSIEYGNGVTTTYTYEAGTYRVETLRTPAAQDLTYTYDPIGNVTHVADAALPTVFRLNTVVDASADYVYDAVYRLVEAHGREHLGIAAGATVPPYATDIPRVQPTDRTALGRYREYYTYDIAGNLLGIVHHRSDPTVPEWRQSFTYAEQSQLSEVPGVFSNRLSGDGFGYDDRGNMTGLPPLLVVEWDHRDQLRLVRAGSSAVPETTYYEYDGADQRVRWVRERQGTRVEERIYLGDFEVYRVYSPATGELVRERTTVQVTDGAQRIVLIEARVDDGAANDPDRLLIRYQHNNHLGSAVLELDGSGGFVSYEEYYPYGCTALLYWRSGVPPKRYRYTGKERDPTGLYYHGARYYAPWLCRWIRCDPAGLTAGPNLYLYAADNPLLFVDPSGNNPEYAARLLQRSQENAAKYTKMKTALAQERAAWKAGDRAGVAAAQSTWRGELHEQMQESMRFSTLAVAGVTAAAAAPIGIAYAAPGAYVLAATHPVATYGVLSFGVGLVDPNPMGSVDIPGPFDDAGRAGAAAGRKAASEVIEHVGGAALRREFPYKANPQAKTIEEAREFARVQLEKLGLEWDPNIVFLEAKGALKTGFAEFGPQLWNLTEKQLKKMTIRWEGHIEDAEGMIKVMVDPDVLKSDEAIIHTFSHEIVEIGSLADEFAGKAIGGLRYHLLTAGEVVDKAHHLAVTKSDELLKAFRESMK